MRQNKYPMNTTPESVYSLTVRGEMMHNEAESKRAKQKNKKEKKGG